MKKIPLVVLLALIIAAAAAVHAQEYYGDIVFDVMPNGDVAISGQTNHPALIAQTTQSMTSKTGEAWKLEISPTGEFSDYIYTIKFPADTELLSVSTSSQYRISDEGGNLSIISADQNKNLYAEVNYRIKETPGADSLPEAIAITAIILVIIAVLGWFAIKKRGKPILADEKSSAGGAKYRKEALTERQLCIVEYLEKKGYTTQAELQKHTNYPKASLSRNLDSLEKKGIIEKERKGMTMLVVLKKN